jgi:hypothetical protein
VTSILGTPPPAPDCPSCDATKTLSIVGVDARLVFTYFCSCCGKQHHFAANTVLIDYEPQTDVSGRVIDGP